MSVVDLIISDRSGRQILSGSVRLNGKYLWTVLLRFLFKSEIWLDILSSLWLGFCPDVQYEMWDII